MALVVLLKGVNVGGHRSFRPSTLSEQLKQFDAVNIGTAGTLVIRRPVGRTQLRAELERRLPFDAEILMCEGREIRSLVSHDRSLFAGQPVRDDMVRFVSLLARRPRSAPPLPMRLPSSGPWLLKILGIDDRFVFGVYRRQMKVIKHLEAVGQIFRTSATTRNWNTITAIGKVLDEGSSKQRKPRSNAMRRQVALGMMLALSAVPVAAQRPLVDAAAWSLAPYVGAAQHSPVGRQWGITPDRQHLVLGVHLEAPVLRVGPATLSYAPSVTPVIRITHVRSAGSTELQEPPAIGMGLAPFGFALRIQVAPSLAIFGNSAVGAAWFSRQVPVPDSREFNFTLEWGGGIELWRTPSQSVELGYTFHHLSNLYSRPQNPGLDANLFYAGWRWYVRPRG